MLAVPKANRISKITIWEVAKMQNKFTRSYYVGLWSEILSTYQWWGRDIVTLLESIKETDPVVVETFWKMYNKTDGKYSIKTLRGYKFYEILSRFMGSEEELEVSTRVKSLKKENELLQTKLLECYRRRDILIAILCFTQEFANKRADNVSMSRYGNVLTARSDSVDFYAEQDKKRKVTYIRITIPCELCMEYWLCGIENVPGIEYIMKKTAK